MGLRNPRPIQPARRSITIAGTLRAMESAGIAMAVSAYPPAARPLRLRPPSAARPPAIFAAVAPASEIPSMSPSPSAGAPVATRRAGRRQVTLSCARSEKKDTAPQMATSRGKAEREPADGVTSGILRRARAGPGLRTVWWGSLVATDREREREGERERRDREDRAASRAEDW